MPVLHPFLVLVVLTVPVPFDLGSAAVDVLHPRVSWTDRGGCCVPGLEHGELCSQHHLHFLLSGCGAGALSSPLSVSLSPTSSLLCLLCLLCLQPDPSMEQQVLAL